MEEGDNQEEITVELETENLQSIQLARRSLIAKILADKPLNKGAVRSILCKAWGEDKRWLPQASVYELDFTKISFWIQIHGLPLDMLNTNNAAKIINRIGDVLEVENPEVEGRLLRTFIRVRALINIQKPLVTGCWVPRKNLPKIWIFFKYEKLQNICFNYGILGHEQKVCSKEKVMSTIDQNVAKYNARLGVPPAKSIISIVKEQNFWRDKGTQKNKEESRHQKRDEGRGSNSGAQPDQGSGADCVAPDFHVPQPIKETIVTAVSDVVPPNQKGKMVVDVNIPAVRHFGSSSGVRTPDFIQYHQIMVHSQSAKDKNGLGSTLGSKAFGPSINATPSGPPEVPITKVDLKEGKQGPGLGPDILDLLKINTEFIGLHKDPVLLDFPSPPKNRYQGADLDPTQVRKVRKFISKQRPVDYYVEFPDDEEDGSNQTDPLKIQQEEESKLISGWNNSLSLKRYWEDAFVDATHLFDGSWEKQKRVKAQEGGKAFSRNLLT
ncbi:Zinc knuckle CX2CX4HX4C [Sesbania bispinosa]|nr:Zinc knuckle CX2CX4HX4C [Sesbania bispinosa]